MSPPLSTTPLRLTQLLLPKEREKAHTNQQLKHQPDPKPRLAQSLGEPSAEIREYVPGPNLIRCRRAGQNRRDGSQHLCRDERERDMDPRQRLQQDHAKADSLKRVEHAEP